MRSIEITFRYWGDRIHANVFQAEDACGVVYPIKLNGHYSFTLHYNESDEWTILQEKDGITPTVDRELLSRIVKPLETKLHYAA